MSRNRWANFKDSIARWRAFFPPILEGGTERLFEFARRVLEAGERERVYRVLEAPEPLNYRADSGKDYLECLRETFDRTGALCLFYSGGPRRTEWGQLRTPALVAFYEHSGAIQEAEIEDLGALIRRLRPDAMETCLANMGPTCPVILDGRARIRAPSSEPEPVRFRIDLKSDIWFPRVMGELDWPEDLRPGPDDMYDNSALASCHTPRLNRFIAAVREAALDLGAQWELEESEEPGLHVHYRPMCHEAGIDLHLRPVDNR